MNTTTTTPTTDMPVIDSPLDPEVADQLGDELILDIAAKTKTQRVRAGQASPSQSRAWTVSGNVD
jgi:cytochrome c553